MTFDCIRSTFRYALPRTGSPPAARRLRAAMLSIDLAAATALVVLGLIPVAFGFWKEDQLRRAYYYQGIANQLVDGEMEILYEGEWKAFRPGRQPYAVQGLSAECLPRGEFFLTLTNGVARLEWVPEDRRRAARVWREVALP